LRARGNPFVFDTPPVASQDRRKPAPNAAIVELHVRVQRERLGDPLSLLLRQPAEVELIVIAEDFAPTAQWPAAAWLLSSP
jgi:hypothetical protein